MDGGHQRFPGISPLAIMKTTSRPANFRGAAARARRKRIAVGIHGDSTAGKAVQRSIRMSIQIDAQVMEWAIRRAPHTMPVRRGRHHNLGRYLVEYIDGLRHARGSQGVAVPHDRARHKATKRHGPAPCQCLCDGAPAREPSRDRDGDGRSTLTAQLYDRWLDDVTLDEVERVLI